MLVFDEGCNIKELWEKSARKMVKFTISGQNSETGTGTGIVDAIAKRYRYRSKSVPVPPSRTESLSIPVRAVPVPMAPTAPIFVIFAYLS